MYKTVFLCFGKRVTEVLSTSCASSKYPQNRAFFVTDRVSNKSFMVDTGSACSIWPLRLVSEKLKKSYISLHAVNLSTIDIYGQISLTLNLGLRRNFRWVFIIAELSYSILGADFLDHFNLLVDVRNKNKTCRYYFPVSSYLSYHKCCIQPQIFHYLSMRSIP